jgi:hypothetical protein
MNDESKKKLTKVSVKQVRGSTILYSPKTVPKTPDKGAWSRDNKQRAETHYAPWPRERDCIENTIRWRKKELTTKRQWSQCDIHHETINAM